MVYNDNNILLMSLLQEKSLYLDNFMGRTGNIMFIWASFISLGLRTGRKLSISPSVYKSLCDLKRYFPNILPDDIIVDDVPRARYKFREPLDFSYSDIKIRKDLDSKGDISHIEFYNSYAQSFSYFEKHWYLIRHYLSPHISIVHKMSNILHIHEREIIDRPDLLKVNKTGALKWVGVHIRRGDYVGNMDYHTFSEDSIKEYMNWIVQNTNFPIAFMVVSDEISWCKKILSDTLQDVYFSPNNVNDHIEDMCLLSRCDHFIISPSTFAWWAVALSRGFGNSSQIVLLPKKWFGEGKSNLSSEDIPYIDWFSGLPSSDDVERYPMKFESSGPPLGGLVPKENQIERSLLNIYTKNVPLSCQLSNYKQLIFDMFTDGKYLYLISMAYKDLEISFSNDVKIILNCVHELVLTKDITLDEYEPQRIVIYNLEQLDNLELFRGSNLFTITVEYGDIKTTHIIPLDICKDRYDLSFTTLFKDDYKCISRTIDFYRMQDVHNFLLAYNGPLKNIWKELTHSEDIFYKEWDFQYWNTGFDNIHIWAHHAQTSFLSFTRYNLLYRTNFLIQADIDEWIVNDKNISLKEYLKDENDALCILHYHSAFSPETIKKLETGENGELIIYRCGNSYPYGTKTKMIYPGGYDGEFGIHSAKNSHAHIKNSTDLKLLHFTNFFHYPEREGILVENVFMEKFNLPCRLQI